MHMRRRFGGVSDISKCDLWCLGGDTDSADQLIGECFSRPWEMFEAGECSEFVVAWAS